MREPLPSIPEESPTDLERSWELTESLAVAGGENDVTTGSRVPSQFIPPTITESSFSESEFEKASDSGFEEQSTEGHPEPQETYQDVGSRLPSYASELYDSVEKSEDYLVPQKLGKRSAMDAFFQDSEHETDKRMHRRNASSSTSQASNGSTSEFELREEPMKAETNHTSDGVHRYRRHLKRPSLIPRPATSTSRPASEPQSVGSQVDGAHDTQQAEHDRSRSEEKRFRSHSQMEGESYDPVLVSTSGTIIGNTEPDIEVEEILHTQSKVASDDLLISDTDDETASTDNYRDNDDQNGVKDLESVVPPFSNSSSDEAPRQALVDTETESNVDKNLETPKVAGDSDVKGTPTKAEDNDDPGSPTPVKPRHVPSISLSIPEHSSPYSTCPSYEGEAETNEPQTNEPQLDWTGGILRIMNTRRADFITYKVAITVSVKLQQGKSRGWDDLIVPGLPRSKDGESGFFLFLLPRSRGMEFRTTNFLRHRFVENCFFAEFMNSRDLVVPLRICDPKFYGIVKDFTVDQEIRADHDVQGGKINVIYNAMCSLRLHNRCFWAEECCFFLYIDGGPEGDFQCRTGRPGAPFPVFRLPEGKPIGVSHVQVTCPPKVLETFCISWNVESLGKQELRWLPRIYPESTSLYERERHTLRQRFTELFDPVSGTETDDTDSDGNDTVADPPAPAPAPANPTNGQIARRASRETSGASRLTTLENLFFALVVLCALTPVNIIIRYPNSNYAENLTTISDKAYLTEDLVKVNEEYCPIEYPDLQEAICSLDEISVVRDIEPEEVTTEEPELAAIATQISLRDRIDYLLGWKGPVRQD